MTGSKAVQEIWVIGGGRFGRRALNLLRQSHAEAAFVLVDEQPQGDLPPGVEMVRADGAAWLAGHLTVDAAVGKIIPALPLHLAAEWLQRRLSAEGAAVSRVPLTEESVRQLPHPHRLRPEQAVISHADFLCPENCSEPQDHCTVTGRPRPQALHRLLENLPEHSMRPLIVRSRQFAAGVGGFLPQDLWNLLESARALPHVPLLIGTACKCHGIVTGLSFTPRH